MLAAVDVHEPMDPVVDRIVPWARRLGATLDLCFASQWSTEGLPAPSQRTDELDRLWTEWAKRAEVERARLEAQLLRVPEDVRGRARLLSGPPAAVLHDAAAGYDLTCVVTHGRTGLPRLVSGSVAARVVRGAPVPVLVLGLGDPVPQPAESLRVLAPMDGHGDLGALRWVGTNLLRHHTELAHVRTDGAPVWVPGPPRTVFAPQNPDVVRAELAARAAAVGFADAPMHLVDSAGHPGDALVALAKEQSIDLIVMPTHGRHGLARLVLGSVAERVAEHAHCAVLVVPLSLT
jgi:nucleotide-binding universal stress UspA family protein